METFYTNIMKALKNKTKFTTVIKSFKIKLVMHRAPNGKGTCLPSRNKKEQGQMQINYFWETSL